MDTIFGDSLGTSIPIVPFPKENLALNTNSREQIKLLKKIP